MFSSIVLACSLYTLPIFSSPLPPPLSAPPSAPLAPSRDPWYTAPPDFASTAPGTVLRIRTAPGNVTSATGNCSATYNILYRTTNSLNEPSWAVTTLFLPVHASASHSNHASQLLSYQIPYNSASVDSSPSYTFAADLQSPLTLPDVPNALGLGCYVNIPDFEGPLAAVVAGILEGHAVLDSVRAVLNSGRIPTTSAHHTNNAMWGYSGGSIASEWAVELQPSYAPELHFVGTALGGLATNVTSGLEAAEGGPFAGLVPNALLGLTAQYPAAREYLLSQLKETGPYNKTTFLSVQNMTIDQSFVVFNNQIIYDYFIHGRDSIIGRNSPLKRLLDQEGLAGHTGTPQMPLYMYKAVQDEILFVNETDALVEKWCSEGVSVQYFRNTVGGHLAEMTNGDGHAMEWLGRVLGGEKMDKGCIVRDVTWNVTGSPLWRSAWSAEDVGVMTI